MRYAPCSLPPTFTLEAMKHQRVFPRILALAEQMWYSGTLAPMDVFYEKVLQRKDWFEAKGYGFGPAFAEDVDEEL